MFQMPFRQAVGKALGVQERLVNKVNDSLEETIRLVSGLNGEQFGFQLRVAEGYSSKFTYDQERVMIMAFREEE